MAGSTNAADASVPACRRNLRRFILDPSRVYRAAPRHGLRRARSFRPGCQPRRPYVLSRVEAVWGFPAPEATVSVAKAMTYHRAQGRDNRGPISSEGERVRVLDDERAGERQRIGGLVEPRRSAFHVQPFVVDDPQIGSFADVVA